MVSFVSLFLGLVLGTQTVAVQVADPVYRVEILLDGKPAVTFEGPPWEGKIDFGQNLVPLELVAVAYDRSDTELDRATQWINLPRPPAEITILLERDDAGQALNARVSWESLVDHQPSTVQAHFDGTPLAFEEPHLISLPPHDPELLHLLRVEIEFGGIVRANAEIAFGGTYMDQVNSELTAIPVTLAGRRKPPEPSETQAWFVARGEPLRVAAIEKGQADLIVVRDQGAWSLIRQVRSQALSGRAMSNLGRLNRDGRRQWFEPDHPGWEAWAFQFLWPVPSRRVVGENPYDLFTHTQKYVGVSGSLHGWVTTIEQPEDTVGDQRLADAVAVAAVAAAGGNRRRGVLLVLGAEADDSSEATPEVVRHYLAALGVPLFVWSPDAATARDSPWGRAANVSTPSLMARATSRIFHDLERQRIVWVEGTHLPQQVSVKDSVRSLQTLAHPQFDAMDQKP